MRGSNAILPASGRGAAAPGNGALVPGGGAVGPRYEGRVEAPTGVAPGSGAVSPPEDQARPAGAADPVTPLPVLVRLGGLPARAVPQPAEELVAALERLRGLGRELEGASQDLLDLLYATVPTLGRARRREVLRARRNVYHRRAAGLSPGVREVLPEGVRAALTRWDTLVQARQEAEHHLEAQVQADLSRSRDLLAAGLDEPGYLRAVAVATPTLVATLARRGRRVDDPRVLRTLYTLATRAALKTSPFSGLTTVGQAGAPAYGRSHCTVAVHLAHGILAATAREVDPDGTLLLGPATVRAAAGAGVPTLPGAREAAGPGTAQAGRPGTHVLAQPGASAETDSPDPDGGTGEPGESAGAARPAGEETLLAVLTEHDYANGMCFRREEVLPATWVQGAHRTLAPCRPASLVVPGEPTALPGAPSAGLAAPRARPDAAPGGPPAGQDPPPVGVRQACALVGGRDPRARLRRLLASGAVVAHVPWRRGDNPFPALADTLSPGQRRSWDEDLRWLAGLDKAVASAGPVQRSGLLARAGRLASRVFPDGELGERPGGVLYEDCEPRTSQPDPLQEEPFRQDVRALARLADPWVTRSHLYDLMVERFVACYGRGGVCRDPLAFVMTLAHAPDGDTEMMRAAAQDHAVGADPERAAMPGGASACPRNLGAYLQPVAPRQRGAPAWQARAPRRPGAAAARPQDTAGGPARHGRGQEDPAAVSAVQRGLTVVNAFTTGTGALHARFHRLLGEDYRERLARQIRASWGTERVLELEVSTECHSGQAVACGVLPPLGLPGEPQASGAVSLSTLRLVHDPATDTLFLADSRGPVGLAYLGLVPRHLLGGYLAWLVLLSDPWSRLAPWADHWSTRSREMTGPLPDQTVHEPRATRGSLVTRRESWTLPAAQVSGLLERDPVASLEGAARLRDRLGAPAEVYVHQHLPGQGATFDEHKPRYVDLRSPVSLLSLRGWVDQRAEHLSLVEALPAREELTGATDSGEPTVVEHLVSLQWPKTESPGGA